MGVYIKGVTKSQLMKVIINSTEFMPDDFEVIEVKTPHGRLIDVTEIISKVRDSESAVLLSKASTVIESEVK